MVLISPISLCREFWLVLAAAKGLVMAFMRGADRFEGVSYGENGCIQWGMICDRSRYIFGIVPNQHPSFKSTEFEVPCAEIYEWIMMQCLLSFVILYGAGEERKECAYTLGF